MQLGQAIARNGLSLGFCICVCSWAYPTTRAIQTGCPWSFAVLLRNEIALNSILDQKSLDFKVWDLTVSLPQQLEGLKIYLSTLRETSASNFLHQKPGPNFSAIFANCGGVVNGRSFKNSSRHSVEMRGWRIRGTDNDRTRLQSSRVASVEGACQKFDLQKVVQQYNETYLSVLNKKRWRLSPVWFIIYPNTLVTCL